MSCPAYWNRRVKHELTPTYPATLFIQARAYNVKKHVGVLVVPGVELSGGDPIKAVRRFLATLPDPQRYIVQYHRAGGFSYLRKPDAS